MSWRVHAEAQAAPKSSFVPVRTGLLAGSRGKQLVSQRPLVQTKLTINQPNDRYEQEADRVADEVMRIPEPHVQRQFDIEEEEEEMLQTKPLANEITTLVQVQHQQEPEEEVETLQAKPLAEQITPLVQRQVEEEEEEFLQVKSRDSASPEVAHDLESEINAIRGGGRSLSGYERAYFEPRFGYDFSQVRLHTNAKTAESVRMMNARAFTIGQDVMFGARQYMPETSTGRQLLAHELTHVVQQKGAKSKLITTVTSKNDPVEHEAHKVGNAISKGHPVPPITARLSSSTIAGIWGYPHLLQEQDTVSILDFDGDVGVSYNPDTDEVRFTGDHAVQYLRAAQPDLLEALIGEIAWEQGESEVDYNSITDITDIPNIHVSQLGILVRAHIESALGQPLQPPREHAEYLVERGHHEERRTFGPRRTVRRGDQARMGPGRIHAAMDVTARQGTPVYAPLYGVVVFAGRTTGFGNRITIYHRYPPQTDAAGAVPVTTTYAHLHRIAVSQGDEVHAGQVIGTVGLTIRDEHGNAGGVAPFNTPHLHFSVQRAPLDEQGATETCAPHAASSIDAWDRYCSAYEEREDIQVRPDEWLDDLFVNITGGPMQ